MQNQKFLKSFSPAQDDKTKSIADSEALADVLGVFGPGGGGDGVFVGGDGAGSLFVGDEVVFAETEFAGALAGLDESGGREVGPVEVGFVEEVFGFAVGDGDVLVFRGQEARGDDVDAGGDVEAAGPADEDEAAGSGLVESRDEGAGGLEEVVHVSGAGAVGADNGIDADGLRGDI